MKLKTILMGMAAVVLLSTAAATVLAQNGAGPGARGQGYGGPPKTEEERLARQQACPQQQCGQGACVQGQGGRRGQGFCWGQGQGRGAGYGYGYRHGLRDGTGPRHQGGGAGAGQGTASAK